MTKPTGSPNLDGLLGSLDEIADFVTQLFTVGEDEIDRDIRERREKGFVSEDKGAEPDTRLVRVKDLRIGDRVVLEDRAWEVTGLNVDGFAKDRIEVSLSNAEVYDMLTFAYVDVEN